METVGKTSISNNCHDFGKTSRARAIVRVIMENCWKCWQSQHFSRFHRQTNHPKCWVYQHFQDSNNFHEFEETSGAGAVIPESWKLLTMLLKPTFSMIPQRFVGFALAALRCCLAAQSASHCHLQTPSLALQQIPGQLPTSRGSAVAHHPAPPGPTHSWIFVPLLPSAVLLTACGTATARVAQHRPVQAGVAAARRRGPVGARAPSL